jgi:putative ABC transport system ATP-binding protein
LVPNVPSDHSYPYRRFYLYQNETDGRIYYDHDPTERAGTDAPAEARRLLTALGLAGENILQRPVTALSIGQQQRVAAARALLGRPRLIIADEPTSALDHEVRGAFLELLLREVAAAEATLLFVSHDVGLAPLFSRTLALAEINHATTPTAEVAA